MPRLAQCVANSNREFAEVFDPVPRAPVTPNGKPPSRLRHRGITPLTRGHPVTTSTPASPGHRSPGHTTTPRGHHVTGAARRSYPSEVGSPRHSARGPDQPSQPARWGSALPALLRREQAGEMPPKTTNHANSRGNDDCQKVHYICQNVHCAEVAV